MSAVRKYRETAYRLRAHPYTMPPEYVDQRDSFFRVYLSIVPFLCLEYLVEASFESVASGLLFPMGYLLFWAFYYTYYRPGYLENKLSDVGNGDLSEIPRLIFGVAIWFVKVTLVELLHLMASLLKSVFYTAPARPRAVYVKVEAGHTPPPFHAAAASHHTGSHHRPAPERPTVPPLPAELTAALHTLGLADCRDWKVIHHRYRELAKKYHPDLNHEITAAGRHFMQFDAAYRKLLAVKGRYFHESK